MKKRYLFFGALLLNALGLQAQSLNHLQGCDKGSVQNISVPCWNHPHILVFEDNFDGFFLSESDWGNKWPPGSPYMHPDVDVQEYNTLENVSVNNGKATITAKWDPAMRVQAPGNGPGGTTLTDGTDGFSNLRPYDYTSASVWSKYVFGNGYFEMMCRVPSASGYWPAFWLYNEVEGVNTELDVFEMWDDNPYDVSLSIHNGQMCSDKYEGANYSNGWHKFGVYWDDWMIVWMIDNVAVQHTYKWYVPTWPPVGITCEQAALFESIPARINSSYPEIPMQLIFNLAVRLSIADPAAPAIMEVDYIRFYQQRSGCNTDVLYETTESLGLDDGAAGGLYYHHRTNNNIDIHGTVAVPDDKQLRLTASQEVNVNINPVTGLPDPSPGMYWDVDPGANVEIVIDPNVCSNYPQLPISNVIREAPDQMMEGLVNPDGTLGLNLDMPKPERVFLSPNPSNQDVVTVISTERTKVIITNSLGRKVKEIEVQAGENQMNIQDLNSGVYQLYFESLKETVKLVRL